MKPFVPAATTPEEANQTIDAIRNFLLMQAFPTESKLYRSVTAKQGKKTQKHVVGQYSPLNREVVVAILSTPGEFLVCTTYRGVLGGEPIEISKDLAVDWEAFDSFRIE